MSAEAKARYLELLAALEVLLEHEDAEPIVAADAERIRDEMDAPWFAMTDAEQDECRQEWKRGLETP